MASWWEKQKESAEDKVDEGLGAIGIDSEDVGVEDVLTGPTGLIAEEAGVDTDSWWWPIVNETIISGGQPIASWSLLQSLFRVGEGIHDSTQVDAPEMSPEEQQAIEEVQGLVEEYQNYYEQIMPIIAHQMHYTIDTDEEGNDIWRPMTDEEWYNDERTTDSQRRQWDIYKDRMGVHELQLERQQKALRGELPLTEQMKQQKQEEFEKLKAQSGIVGESPDTAGAEDTIGVQQLDKFNQRWNVLEDLQRRGELTAGNQNLISQQGLTQDITTPNPAVLQGMGTARLQGGLSGYQSIMNPYQYYNELGYQAQAQNAATNMAMLNSLLNFGGMSLGYGAEMGTEMMTSGGGAAGIAAMSSRKFKKDIKKKTAKEEDEALKKLKKTKSYEFKYKDEMNLGDDKYLGTMVEESPEEIIGPDKMSINLMNKMEYIGMGLKALARKVDNIERRT